jgi:hypothetical protein
MRPDVGRAAEHRAQTVDRTIEADRAALKAFTITSGGRPHRARRHGWQQA